MTREDYERQLQELRETANSLQGIVSELTQTIDSLRASNDKNMEQMASMQKLIEELTAEIKRCKRKLLIENIYMSTIYNQKIEESFNQMKRIGRRKYLQLNWKAILDDAQGFTQQAEQLLEEGHPVEAASMALSWLKCFTGKFEEEAFMADEDGFIMSEFCRQNAQVAEDAVACEGVSEEFRREALAVAQLVGKSNTLDDYYFINGDAFAKRMELCLLSPEEEIVALEGVIVPARGDSTLYSPLPKLAIRRYELLKGLGRLTEAQQLALEDASNVTFCEYVVKDCLSMGDKSMALKMVDTGIAVLDALPYNWDGEKLQKIKDKI